MKFADLLNEKMDALAQQIADKSAALQRMSHMQPPKTLPNRAPERGSPGGTPTQPWEEALPPGQGTPPPDDTASGGTGGGGTPSGSPPMFDLLGGLTPTGSLRYDRFADVTWVVDEHGNTLAGVRGDQIPPRYLYVNGTNVTYTVNSAGNVIGTTPGDARPGYGINTPATGALPPGDWHLVDQANSPNIWTRTDGARYRIQSDGSAEIIPRNPLPAGYHPVGAAGRPGIWINDQGWRYYLAENGTWGQLGRINSGTGRTEFVGPTGMIYSVDMQTGKNYNQQGQQINTMGQPINAQGQVITQGSSTPQPSTQPSGPLPPFFVTVGPEGIGACLGDSCTSGTGTSAGPTGNTNTCIGTMCVCRNSSR